MLGAAPRERVAAVGPRAARRWPRSTITAAGTVIHGLRSRSAQTEKAKRPPGRSTRRTSRERRRRVALEDVAEAREHAVDARVRRARAAPRRARGTRRSSSAELVAGAARRLDHVRRAVARDQPARLAEARARRGSPSRPCPPRARGSSAPAAGRAGRRATREISRVDSWSRLRRRSQRAAICLPQLVVGARHGARLQRAQRGELVRRRLPLAGRGVRAHLLGRGRARDHRARPSAARRGRRSRRRAAAAPRSRANASSASIRSHVASSTSSPCAARRVPSGAGSPRRYFPVSSPLASGKYGQQPEPEPLARRDQVALRPRGRASEYSFCAETNRVEAARRGDLVRLLDLRGREVRAADVAHLALADELVHRAERLLDRA